MSIFPPTTLAIDYGTIRVGVARSFGTLAEPLEVVRNDQTLLPKLQHIIEKEGIAQLLIGVSENEMAERSRAFGAAMADLTGLPVFYMDETLSSKSVEMQLHDLGKTQPDQRSVVDHLAAAHFLQEWLDEYSSK